MFLAPDPIFRFLNATFCPTPSDVTRFSLNFCFSSFGGSGSGMDSTESGKGGRSSSGSGLL